MIKVLGALDLITCIWMMLTYFGWMQSKTVTIILASYLILKGIIFWGDIASYLDIAIGIFLILILAGIKLFSILTLIFAVHLLIKSFMSLYA
jgi:hypothetical protein